MKGYSYGYGMLDYRLAVLQVAQARIYGWRFSFESKELDEFWAQMCWRRDRLLEALGRGLPPEPFAYCAEWECKRCPALILCEATKNAGAYVPKPITTTGGQS